MLPIPLVLFFFFFNDTATTEIYTLSLHDALPIYYLPQRVRFRLEQRRFRAHLDRFVLRPDRKSTRLNSSHGYISYAVFCLKKKKFHHKCPRDASNYLPEWRTTPRP